MTIKIRLFAKSLLIVCLAATLTTPGCSSAPVKEAKENSRSLSAADLEVLFTKLGSRIQSLENKLDGINKKLESNLLNSDPLQGQVKSTEIIAHPTDLIGTPVQPLPVSTDPEAGFVNDNAVQSFRQSLILFQGQKYPEAVLGFSGFLEKFQDHPLAGSAQFYIGQSYLKQSEFRLAVQEFQKVLTSYDQSPHLADTLSAMAAAEKAIGKDSDAAKHRQLLTALFPQSPAAAQSLQPTPVKSPQPILNIQASEPDKAEPTPTVTSKSNIDPPPTLSSPEDSENNSDPNSMPPTAPNPALEDGKLLSQ